MNKEGPLHMNAFELARRGAAALLAAGLVAVVLKMRGGYDPTSPSVNPWTTIDFNEENPAIESAPTVFVDEDDELVA